MTSVKITHHLQDTKEMDFLKKGYKDFLNFFSGPSAYAWSSLINQKCFSSPKNKHKSPKPKCATHGEIKVIRRYICWNEVAVSWFPLEWESTLGEVWKEFLMISTPSFSADF